VWHVKRPGACSGEEADRQRPGPGKYQTCEAGGAMLV
jgi:hypothetical protein